MKQLMCLKPEAKYYQWLVHNKEGTRQFLEDGLSHKVIMVERYRDRGKLTLTNFKWSMNRVKRGGVALISSEYLADINRHRNVGIL